MKPCLLISGCGDIGMRAANLLQASYRVIALARSSESARRLRMAGILPIIGDLDRPSTLARVAGLADAVLHLAPPPASGTIDTRTRHLIAALSRGRKLPQRLVYISTSGVYGDCGGAWVDETRPINPRTPRAQRRADAEAQLRCLGKRAPVRVVILRVPGIYAHDRLPLARLRDGIPALAPEDDGYTNHIHADDLAAIAIAALRHGRSNRCYHAADDQACGMGDYFDLLADHFCLARPARVPRAQASALIPAGMLSFMNESRRLANTRIKKELGVVLKYPSVEKWLGSAGKNGGLGASSAA